MISVITGDVINSRRAKADEWLGILKTALSSSGTKKQWEIYRGDSFQLEISPDEALLKSLYLKACIKTIKQIDVRIGIGIGAKNYSADKISQSNGEAFIFSGEKLEELKKERLTMAIQTPWEDFNYEINVSLRLALIAADNWSPVSAEMVKLSIENSGISQIELAELSKKSQSTVSEALKRARLSEILDFDTLYRKKLNSYIKK